MGSKTQIALPETEEERAASAASDSGSATSGEAEVIRAFLPPNRLDTSANGPDDRPAPDDADEGEAHDGPQTPDAAQASASAGTTGLPAISHKVEDPELIELLEQLSATIDNANMVLSEAPPLRGPVTDEYAAAGVAAAPLTPAPVQETPSRAGRIAAVLLPCVFVCAAAGGYWWFKTNPWLLDGTVIQDTAFSVAPPTAPAGEVRQESIEARVPAPPREVPTPARNEAGRMTASLAPAAAVPEPDTATAPASGKPAAPVNAAAEPARAPAGSPIPIDLALPRSDGQEVSVMVQGVPQGVTLSSGSFIGGGTWVLTEQEAANLVLRTPASFNPQAFAVDVVFVKSDGKVPESRRIDIVVDPAHAPAPAGSGLAAGDAAETPPAPTPANVAVHSPASGGPAFEGYEDKPEPEEKSAENTGFPTAPPSTLSKEQEAKLLARGKEFMELGDVASARLIYGHAARLGSKDAMLALGKTFDPAHLASLGVRGVQPDQNQAHAWYERASRQADR